MSKRSQKRMVEAVRYLQDYMATYDKQPGYMNYTDATLMNDVVYGLGVALNKKEYSQAIGFQKFKEALVRHLAGWDDEL